MKVNPVRKTFSEIGRAYLAGFLDGDGAIMACIERHKEKKFRFRVRIFIKIVQQNKKVLEWCKSITQLGKIRWNRTLYSWQVRDQKEIRSFLRQLMPFLKVKKKQAILAMKILDIRVREKPDLLKAARLADALSKFNVRSKGRRKNFVAMIEENVSPND